MSKNTKMGRGFFNRQFTAVFIIILVLLSFSVLLVFFINELFPNNGGFTRNILFIKQSEEGDPAYFIVVDEIFPKNNIPVDWILH